MFTESFEKIAGIKLPKKITVGKASKEHIDRVLKYMRKRGLTAESANKAINSNPGLYTIEAPAAAYKKFKGKK